jgi:MarR family transcriptional regulator, organic hydroperoxide resistance regulator
VKIKIRGVIAFAAGVVERANALITKKLAARGLKKIAPAYGAIFYRLFDGGELSMGEIAARIHRDKSTITNLVTRLVALGYAEQRNSLEDRRVVYVRITEAGMALKPVFDQISDEMLTRAYRGFSNEEQQILVQLLERMVHNLAEPDAQKDKDM